MFNLLQTASDDQTAIVACILTLSAAGLFVMASFHLGPAGQKQRNRQRSNSLTKIPTQISTESHRSQDRAA